MPEDVPDADVLRKVGYDLKREISIISHCSSDTENLIRLLKGKGINFILTRKKKLPKSPLKKDKVTTKVIVRIDHKIMRGISKIAFNYLAFMKGKRYVLRKTFDGLRSFIRYDKGRSIDYFLPRKSSPVQFNKEFEYQHNIRHNNGHILMIQWSGTELLYTLDLFITNNYVVKFCENCVRETDPPTILAGHFFDTDSKKVHKIQKYRIEYLLNLTVD